MHRVKLYGSTSCPRTPWWHPCGARLRYEACHRSRTLHEDQRQVSFLDHALHPLFPLDVGEPMIRYRPLRQVSFLDHALHPPFPLDVGEPMIGRRPPRQVSCLDRALRLGYNIGQGMGTRA